MTVDCAIFVNKINLVAVFQRVNPFNMNRASHFRSITCLNRDFLPDLKALELLCVVCDVFINIPIVTIGFLILLRVLLPQTGHNIHSHFIIISL